MRLLLDGVLVFFLRLIGCHLRGLGATVRRTENLLLEARLLLLLVGVLLLKEAVALTVIAVVFRLRIDAVTWRLVHVEHLVWLRLFDRH